MFDNIGHLGFFYRIILTFSMNVHNKNIANSTDMNRKMYRYITTNKK